VVLKVIEPHPKLGINGVENLNLNGVQDCGNLINDDSIAIHTIASIQLVLQNEDPYDTSNNHADNQKTNSQRQKHLHLPLKRRIKLLI
jgi:hypothetical protein